MVAAQNGNLKMSKLFVYKGANPNHQVRASSVCTSVVYGYLWGERVPSLQQAAYGHMGGGGRKRVTHERMHAM